MLARPGDWDQLWRAPSEPDLVVATSVFRSALRCSEDGGRAWQDEEPLPADAFGPALATDDPDRALFPYGLAYEGYGADLFRWEGGLATLAVTRFDGFYEVFALEFGPLGPSVLFLGTSSDIPQ